MLFFLLFSISTFGFNFKIDQQQFTQCLCGKYSVPITIENTGVSKETYDIGLGGKDAGNAWLSENHFSLKAGEKKQLILNYTIPCESKEFFELTLNVESDNEAQLINYQVMLGKCNNVYFVVDAPTDTCSCTEKEIKFLITNTGSFDESYTIGLTSYNEYAELKKQKYDIKAGEYVVDSFKLKLPCERGAEYDFALQVTAEKNNLKSVVPLNFDFDSCGFQIEEKEEKTEINPVVLMLLITAGTMIILLIVAIIIYQVLKEHKKAKKRDDFIEEQISLEKHKYDDEIEDKFITLEELDKEQQELKKAKISKEGKYEYVYDEKRDFFRILKFFKWLALGVLIVALLGAGIYFIWKQSQTALGYLGYVFLGAMLLVLSIVLIERYWKKNKLEIVQYEPEKEKKKKAIKKTQKVEIIETKKYSWKNILGWILVGLIIIGSLIGTYFIGYFIYGIVGCSVLVLIIIIHTIYLYSKEKIKFEIVEKDESKTEKEEVKKEKKYKKKDSKEKIAIKKFRLPKKR